jgi:arsenate reductase
MAVILWHNPRCSTSRAALALLAEHEVVPELRLYLDDPPSVAELRALRKLLGVPAIAMIRTKEPLFRELGLSRDTPEAALFAAMKRHPVLIERPVLIAGGKARIGRPPEAVLQIL